jgi:hypothetical protein
MSLILTVIKNRMSKPGGGLEKNGCPCEPDPPPTPQLGAVSPKPAPKKTLLAQTTQKMMFRQAIRLQEDKANQTDTQKIINSRQSQFHTSVTNRGMAADPQSVAQLLQASLDAKQAKQGTYSASTIYYLGWLLSSDV